MEIRRLLGLLCWFTSAALWLRPWLSVLFRLLMKPKLRFQSLDSKQLEELAAATNIELVVSQECYLSDVQVGWRILAAGQVSISSVWELLGAPFRNGRAWVKFADAASSSTKVTREEAEVAFFFFRVVRQMVPVPLVITAVPGLAAADAFAEGKNAGLGGWWLVDGAPLSPGHIKYFSIQLHWDDLPALFRPADSNDLQSCISALEALAQLVLLSCRCEDGLSPEVGWIALRQSCDNLGLVCSTAKGLSLKQPLASVLQSTALFALQRRVSLQLRHIAGERNDWADALSRGCEVLPDFWAQLRPSLMVRPDWLGLLNSGLKAT